MNTTLLGKFSISAIALGLFLSAAIFAQTDEVNVKRANFRYSQNPKTRTKTESAASQTTEPAETTTQLNSEVKEVEDSAPQPSIAKKTLEVAKKAATAAIVPSEVYKVGVGDVLFINLQNAPKSSTYFTILNDGTIDYPLAGEMISIAGMTTDEIEELLKEKVKIFENPQISVKVREFSSHTISVLGLVERSGEKKIQREAVPLFVVRAEAIVQPSAVSAVIRRSNSQTETISLKDNTSDNVLIFPGDIVEFVGEKAVSKSVSPDYYFIGGEILTGGQKDFHEGLTLTQAILASGGLKKASVKKIVLRRKSAEGLLVPTEYNLKSIKDGKEPDPILMAGDTIEIGM